MPNRKKLQRVHHYWHTSRSGKEHRVPNTRSCTTSINREREKLLENGHDQWEWYRAEEGTTPRTRRWREERKRCKWIMTPWSCCIENKRNIEDGNDIKQKIRKKNGHSHKQLVNHSDWRKILWHFHSQCLWMCPIRPFLEEYIGQSYHTASCGRQYVNQGTIRVYVGKQRYVKGG